MENETPRLVRLDRECVWGVLQARGITPRGLGTFGEYELVFGARQVRLADGRMAYLVSRPEDPR